MDAFGESKALVNIVFTVSIFIILVIATYVTVPLLKEKLYSVESCSKVEVNFISEGENCLDSNQNVARIIITREYSLIDESSLKLYLVNAGNSIYYGEIENFKRNTEKTFYLNTSGLNRIGQFYVVPVLKGNSLAIECSAIYLSNLQPCNLGKLSNQTLLSSGKQS